MNFLSKQMKNKIIAQALVATSVFGVGIGYNLVFSNTINVNALYSSNSSTGNITQFVSGGNFNVFMKNDGTVWAMGENWNGQLGLGTTSAGQFTPMQVPITNVKTIICGMNHTIFIKNDGTVWGCGRNDYGQLGIGNTVINQLTPVQIPITNVQSVICGYHHTIFIKNDGTAWSTGDNDRGQLGIGNVINQFAPVQMIGGTNVKDAVCGGFNTLLVKNDGTTWGTGYNNVGQFGWGDTNNRYTPTQTPIINFSSIVGGVSGYIYIKNDGTVWGTGYNAKGQLGIGNTIDQLTPVQIPITDVKSIYGGTYETYFIKNDGTTWGCGGNSKGELGIGNYTQQNSIIQLSMTGLSSVGSGQNFNIYFKSDGSIWASGDNNAGQFGLSNNSGSTTGLSNPVNLTAYWSAVATATSAVVKAESSKLQVDVNSAFALVNALPSGNDKNGLTNRLNAVQYSINLANATSKVTTAENTKLQSDIDIAQTSINLLSAGTDKTSLQARLDIVKVYIAVVKAETTKTQADVNSATTLVNALSSSTTKTDLTNRLASVQTYINNVTNASNKVATAESTKTQVDVDFAQTAINLLPIDDTNKIALQDRVDIVRAYIAYQVQLTIATNAVVLAESSKLQADLDSAFVLVNTLSSTDKTILTSRLTVVQTYINNVTDATTKVDNAEKTKTQDNLDLAQTAINLLQDGLDKTLLQSRLDVVEEYIVYQTQLVTATNSVIIAEESKLQADVDSAKVLVNILSNTTDKNILTSRLFMVQTYINNVTDALNKVTNAENTKIQVDVDLAQIAINKLPDGTDKTNLQNELDKIKQQIADKNAQDQLTQATKLVTTAESTKNSTDITKAQNAVLALPNSTDKIVLQSRLDTLKTPDENLQVDFKEAKLKVQIAEVSVNLSSLSTYITNAQKAINKLPSCEIKTTLQTRLNAINNKLAININNSLTFQAKPLVQLAELYKTSKYINQAWVVVNQITDCQVKTDYINRLNAIK